MHKLLDRHGHTVVARALRYLRIRLAGRPETAPLAGDIQILRETLAARHDAHEEAKESRVAATAEILYVDGRLDAAVQDVARKVLVEVSGDRSHQRYRRLFPVAPSQATKATGGASQARFVRAVADGCEQDPALAGEAPALREHLAALELAEARREELFIPEARTQAELTAALEAARRGYNTTHARLTLLFPDDPTLVDSFFADLYGRRASPADDEADES